MMNGHTQTVLKEQIAELLDALAAFGAEPDGGVTRLLYSPAWVEAQSYLEGAMTRGGLEARYDRVGNLFGRLQGRGAGGVVLTGSHIDTVRSGGRFDGAYGIAASLAAVRLLRERCGAPVRTIEVVSFCEEEGSRFPLAYWGSGSVTGAYTLESAGALHDPQGVSMRAAMTAAGFGRPEQPDPKRSDLAAYLEVHIEQGVTLERAGDKIGLVESIAGQRRYVVTLTGETNHAGTTPMAMRQDAMAGAAEMIALLEKAALRAGAPLVATAGRLKIVPNNPNVIPGYVSFTVDVRHTSETLLTGFCDAVLGAFRTIADKRGLELGINAVLHTRPAPMDPLLLGRFEKICADRSIPYRRMMSGAGHDPQMFSGYCPTALLFVPSREGVSHSPNEYTDLDDLALGASVLMEMLYNVAYGEKTA